MGDPLTAFGISVGLNLISGLFAPTQVQKAPEPNLRLPRSKYNDPIPLVYGTVRLGTNKFYPDTVDKLYIVETNKKSQGGKGGGPKVKSEEKVVYATFAALLCQNTTTLQKVFLNGREIIPGDEFYDQYITFFDGTQTNSWSEMQVLSSPPFNQVGYLGLSYLAFTRLNVSGNLFGNQVPQQVDAIVTDARFGANPTLDVVVQDICVRAGLSASEIDVTELASIVLEQGLAVDESGDGYRKVLEDLMQFYLFTGYEDTVTGKIVFKTYDRGLVPTVVTIAESDFLPISEDGIDNQLFIKTTTPQQELPNKLTLTFTNTEKQYESDEIVEYFEAFTKENNIDIDTRLTTYADYVRQRARLILSYNFISQRNTYRFKVPATYLTGPNALQLVELVLLPNGDIVQIHQMNPGNDFELDCLGKLYYPQTAYDYTVIPPTEKPGPNIPDTIIPDVYVIDTGRFSTFSPYTAYLFATGACVIQVSSRADFTGSDQVEHRVPSVIGNVDTVLPPITEEDPVNTDTVDITLEVGEVFSSAAKDDPDFLATQYNLALIGSQSPSGFFVGELIQFGTVLDLGGGSYRLSELRRGLFDSFNESNHVLPEKIFVFKDEENLAYYSTLRGNSTNLTTLLTNPIFLRPIASDYQNLGATPVTSFTPAGNAFKPSAPLNIDSEQDINNNVKITWTYDSGYSQYNDGRSDVTYEIDILVASVVQRTISTTELAGIYYVSDRIADGVNFPFDVIVYAVSPQVGRGYGSSLFTVVEDLTPDNIGFTSVDPNANVRGIRYVNGTTNPLSVVDYNVPAEEDRFEIVVQNATAIAYTNLIFTGALPIGFEVFVTNQGGNPVGARVKFVVPTFSSKVDYVDLLNGATAIVTHLGGGIYKITGNNQLHYSTEGIINNDIMRVLNFESTDGTVNITAGVTPGLDVYDVDFSVPPSTGDGSTENFPFDFDDSTTSGDPSSGNIRFNNAAVTSTTSIFVSADDSNGVTRLYDLIATTDLDEISVQSGSPSTRFWFRVTGNPINNGTWVSIPVAFLRGNTPVFPDNESLTIFIAWTASHTDLMRRSVYDSNSNNIVDNSENLNGQLPSFYLDYNNFTNTPTILDTEDVQDIVGALVVPGNDIAVTYDDGGATLTIDSLVDLATGETTDFIFTNQGVLPDSLFNLAFIVGVNVQVRSVTFYNNDPSTQNIQIYSVTTASTLLLDTYSLLTKESITLTFTLWQYVPTEGFMFKASIGNINWIVASTSKSGALLVQGNIPGTALTTVYTCPASTAANIKVIRVLNGNTSMAQTVEFFSNGQAFKQQSLAIGQSVEVPLQEMIRLLAGQTIQIQPSIGNCNYFLEVLEFAL